VKLRPLAAAAVLTGMVVAGAGRAGAEGAPVGDGSLRMLDHGRVLPQLSLAQVRALGTVTVRVHDPYEDRAITFTAIPLDRVLDRAFGPGWRRAEEVVLTCLDGYSPSLPARRIADHHAYLAVSRSDRAAFTLDMKEGKARVRTVPLAPYYVVWDSLGDAAIRQEGHHGWAFQLSGLELVDFKARFGALAPPAGAGDKVARGFAAFRIHCLPCHGINGQGGQVGPELNYPANVTEYFARPYLRRWISDPQSLRWNARMPPLGLEGAERERTIDQLIAYLQAMVRRKIAPP
jgi:mono/diheme cytochrome c family protein